MNNTYFSQFRCIMNPYIGILPESSNEFYTYIFSWYLEGNGKNSISNSQLSKWKNERFVPNAILMEALNSPYKTAVNYSEAINTLFDDSRIIKEFNAKNNGANIKHSPNTKAKNTISLDKDEIRQRLDNTINRSEDSFNSFLETFPFRLPFSDLSLFDISARGEALTTALIYDALYSDDTLIDPVLYQPLHKKLKECRKNHNRFSNMYVLDILLNSPNELLKAMLKKCGNNLLQTLQSETEKYINATHQILNENKVQKYLCDVELIKVAKQLAYFKPLDQSRIAGEADFCRAIVLCHDENTRTIKQLKADLGEMADFEKWNALAIECLSELQTSSIN